MSYTEIDKLLHPDGYYTGSYDYITQLIYRFQRTYKTYFPDNALFSCDRNSQKYYFRDELNIKSDLDELQRLFDLALSESNPNRKLVIMRRFVWLYGDGILPEYDEWPLLKEVRHKYETLYYRILRMMVPNIRSEMSNSADQKFFDDIL
ncbi:hypothetical protein [Butyrivibrio sp. INlla16]|uniref:hypothetical protein n=1 Tax=Butyrivibrio sp. INlla16 TaxID=1520807 RepID=UPI001113ECD3|nr:hypothetical protein [Butyrivibrio sp. INlla16]